MAIHEYILPYLMDFRALSTGLGILLIYYVVKFYWSVSKLPPGPFPLPFIGNVMQLRGGDPLFKKAIRWSRQYGDPFTIWLGNKAVVIASTRESFKEISGPYRNQLGGRMPSIMGEHQSRGFEDVVFGDFTPAWDVLRRLMHVAIRKYAQTEKLANVVAGFVDETFQREFNGAKSIEIDVMIFVNDVINNILAISCFGGKFRKGDPDYEKMIEANDVFQREVPNGLPSDIMPVLGYVFWRTERKVRETMTGFFAVVDKLFADAQNSYEKGKSRHFTDALFAAREEFINDDRESKKYLTDGNIRQAVFDIFGAGTNTSSAILGHSLLRLASDQKMQETLRQEIVTHIGDNEPRFDDRRKLPLVNSFIEEILRVCPAAPLALPRRALADVVINGRKIPRETNLMTNLYAVNRDRSVWGNDADEFKYDRFVGMASTTKEGMTSFGIGARSCPGEKMAQADIFFVIVRTLQQVRIGPASGSAIDLEAVSSDILMDPKRQTLKFEIVA